MTLTYDKTILRAKAEEFCQSNGSRVAWELGFGTQGIVYQTEYNTALKVHSLIAGYVRERDVYLRLRERNIQVIRAMRIPRIYTWDDELLILEMSIVHVPCVLDFGGAYLDHAPEHMHRDAEWFRQKREEFGDDWPKAEGVIRELEYRAAIALADVNPGNIKFAPA